MIQSQKSHFIYTVVIKRKQCQGKFKTTPTSSSGVKVKVTKVVDEFRVDLSLNAGWGHIKVKVVLLVKAKVGVAHQVHCVDDPAWCLRCEQGHLHTGLSWNRKEHNVRLVGLCTFPDCHFWFLIMGHCLFNRRVSRQTHLRMCVYSFRKSKSVKRLNMQYNLKAKGGMHSFDQYRHYVWKCTLETKEYIK